MLLSIYIHKPESLAVNGPKIPTLKFFPTIDMRPETLRTITRVEALDCLVGSMQDNAGKIAGAHPRNYDRGKEAEGPRD